jgi:5-hydroxyisourate hydrolase
MAIVSTHTLDAVEGLHAGGVEVTLRRLARDGAGTVVFSVPTDPGGRLSQTVEIAPEHAGADYELIFAVAAYFDGRPMPVAGRRIVRDIVLRFSMPDPDGRYHLPVILSPNGVSAWWSN